MDRIIENNQVTVVGTIASDFRFSHEVFGEKFYLFDLCARRHSGNTDLVPVMISERLISDDSNLVGLRVKVDGQFRSFNRHGENGNRLMLDVFVRDIEELDDRQSDLDINNIELDGFICKESTYRETPLGREIADVLIAVNRVYGKSDYIPCIAWGRNAKYVSGLNIGTHIHIHGRIQSRQYEKKISETESETRIAYEVSVSKISVVE